MIIQGEEEMLFTLEKKQYACEAKEGDHLSPTPHLHSHVEIVLITEGVSVCVADDCEITLGAGDLFVAFPNQIHYYIDQTENVSHRIVIVSPDTCPEFGNVFKTMLPQEPVLRAAARNEHICRAFSGMIEMREKQSSFSDTEIRGYLLVLFSELFRSLNMIGASAYETDIVKSIIQFCYENYDTDISLQSISDELHISRYYISHLFNRKLHTGFNDYINSLRISRACEMLKRNVSPITDIAYAVGYNSIRSFNRSFQSIMHMTPKEYKSQKQQKKME